MDCYNVALIFFFFKLVQFLYLLIESQYAGLGSGVTHRRLVHLSTSNMAKFPDLQGLRRL